MKKRYDIGIIGAGGWGTALAMLLASNGHKPLLWSLEEEVAQEINQKHTNAVFLPGAKLPAAVKATNKAGKMHRKDLYVLAAPTQYIRALLKKNDFGLKNKPIISVAKGIERKTLLRVSEILTDAIGLQSDNYSVLTGPSHAEEVARKSPTTVVAASENFRLAETAQNIFSNDAFRVYTTNDVIGCEIGGSLKNVIALAAGIIDGLGIGDNIKAALITRGLAEISRLGAALGANYITFSGLSGLGDLIVTCNSRHSRNRNVGEQIGSGVSLEQITNNMQMVAEGIYTTESAYNLGLKHGVETPIIEQMYEILFKKMSPEKAIRNLMNRQSKREWQN